MIKTVTLNRNMKPTEEQIKEIEEAKREIIFEHIFFIDKTVTGILCEIAGKGF